MHSAVIVLDIITGKSYLDKMMPFQPWKLIRMIGKADV